MVDGWTGEAEGVIYDKPWRLYQYQWYPTRSSENIHHEKCINFSSESMWYSVTNVSKCR